MLNRNPPTCPRANSTLVSKSLHLPSLDSVTIREESALKSKLKTPLACPVSSNARDILSNSPDLENFTSHTFTSGVKPYEKKYRVIN